MCIRDTDLHFVRQRNLDRSRSHFVVVLWSLAAEDFTGAGVRVGLPVPPQGSGAEQNTKQADAARRADRSGANLQAVDRCTPLVVTLAPLLPIRRWHLHAQRRLESVDASLFRRQKHFALRQVRVGGWHARRRWSRSRSAGVSLLTAWVQVNPKGGIAVLVAEGLSDRNEAVLETAPEDVA